MIIITPRQFECLRLLILARHSRRNITVREIGRLMDISSPNGVMIHLKSLDRLGLIKRRHQGTPVADCPFTACLPFLGTVPCRVEQLRENCYLLLGEGIKRVVKVAEWNPGVN